VHEYTNQIGKISFDCPHKTDAFRVLLHAKLESDMEQIKAWLATDFDKLTAFEVVEGMQVCIANLVDAGDAAILAAFREKYGKATGEKIFDFVMDSEGGFRAHRNDRINMLHMVSNVFIQHSPIHRNNNERVYTFINSLSIAIYIAVYKAQESFEAFNGQIAKLVRDGNY